MSITFDGATKIATLSTGTTTLSVHDLYSRWKDWVLLSDNSKWAAMFATTGGDTIDSGAGTSVPLYAFLINGWKIKPQEADHTLDVVDGVLLVDGGGDPFTNTTGDYTVRIKYSQPVQAIAFSTSGGGGYTPAQIAAEIFSTMLSGFNTIGTAGHAFNNINVCLDIVQTLLKYQANRTRVDQTTKTLTVYDDDDVTPIRVFDLHNFAGAASVTEVAERMPQ